MNVNVLPTCIHLQFVWRWCILTLSWCSTLRVLHSQLQTSLFRHLGVFSNCLRGTVHVNGDISESWLNGNKPDCSFGYFCRYWKLHFVSQQLQELVFCTRSSWKCVDSQCQLSDSPLSADAAAAWPCGTSKSKFKQGDQLCFVEIELGRTD